MKTRLYIYGALGILAAILLLEKCARRDSPSVRLGGSKSIAVSVLPVNDKEEVSFNEKTHTLTVQTEKSTVKEYAKNPTVEIRKDGSVAITRHLAGLESVPFLGAGITFEGPRLFLGDSFFHIGRLDLNVSIGVPFSSQTAFIRPYVGLGYEVYDNTNLNLVVNPLGAAQSKPDLALFVSLKF